MPFMTNIEPCKKCGIVSSNHRVKNGYAQSTCKSCEYSAHVLWVENHRESYNKYQQKQYIKKYGPITRNMNHTKETRAEWYREKANKRCSRAKLARRNDELTNFVYEEAQNLRTLRDMLFTFKWHVDHIIPLKGKNVSGLHVWNNFAVIPKVDNLRKGNYHSVHD